MHETLKLRSQGLFLRRRHVETLQVQLCIQIHFRIADIWTSHHLFFSPNSKPNSLLLGFSSGFVFHLGWGAVSASLGLSPNLSPIWLCLSPWLGCCVRLAGLVSPFVSHLALSFTLAGVLCPPRWACLPFVSFWLCLSAWLGCCVRLAGLVSGLVSQFVSHLALSFTLAGVLCPPRWACLQICLPVFSPHLFPIWLCLSPWLGCCVRLAGLVFFLSLVLSPSLSGMLCSPSWLVSQPSLSPVFCPILFSSWSGVSVLWACLQNFMCDLCNCLGSTVV